VAASAQEGPGTVKGILKLSQTQGGRTPVLDDNDQLGRSVSVLGDLDGNGVVDLATSGLGDDDGGIDQGAAYILFLRADGRVVAHRKISEITGGFTGILDPGDQFGRSLAGVGDVDGDGVPDLAVGANYDDDGGINRGALWLLFLNPDGTVERTGKISQTQGGFGALLRNNDEFGRAVAPLGDLDGDGDLDIAVSAPLDATGGAKCGAVYVLFLRREGTVERHVKIANGLGGFTGRLRSADWFGFSLANLGDLDGDGVVDLAVGAALDDDGTYNTGAVWLLYLRPDGTVKEHRKISMRHGNFTGLLESPDQFGTSVTRVGDLNGDGVTELAVGAVKDGDGGRERGAVYVLFLTPQGTVAFHQKISDLEGGFPPRLLNNWDWLGSSLAPLGDLDRDGVPDIVIGARNDDDGGPNRGALYLTTLRGATAAMTATSLPGERRTGSYVVDLIDDVGGPEASGLALAPWEALAAGPEPVGDLELVGGDGTPGSRLVFRLRVPEAFAGRDALARLVVAARRSEVAVGTASRGFLLERGALLGALAAVAAPGLEEVEFAVPLPVDPALGDALSLQAVWRLGEERVLSDAVEVRLRR
jgi:hypothetical protein